MPLTILDLKGWAIHFGEPRKKPEVHVDATPFRVAWFDTFTATAYSEPRRSRQADNELYALLMAFRQFGKRRSYGTDNPSALSLGKRTIRHIWMQAMASSANIRIFYVCSLCNLADFPSRHLPPGHHLLPMHVLPVTCGSGRCDTGKTPNITQCFQLPISVHLYYLRTKTYVLFDILNICQGKETAYHETSSPKRYFLNWILFG